MSEGPKTYSLDDELNRGYPEDKPILKEEQKKILERLLTIDRNRLSSEELELMEKLIDRLGSESQRIKDLRRKVEGRGNLDSILLALQQGTENFIKPTPFPSPNEATPPSKPPKVQKAEPEPRRMTPPPPSPKPILPIPTKAESRDSRTSTKPVLPVQPKRKSRDSKPSGMEFSVSIPPPKVPVAVPEPSSSSTLLEEAPETSVLQEISEPKEPKIGPVEVVRRCIIAWNQKAFASEYECYSPSFLKMRKEEYVDRRMSAYLSYNRAGDFVQQLETILKFHIEGDKAEVVCVRAVREFHKQNRYIDLYLLKLERGKWRITGVTTEMNENTKKRSALNISSTSSNPS